MTGRSRRVILMVAIAAVALLGASMAAIAEQPERAGVPGPSGPPPFEEDFNPGNSGDARFVPQRGNDVSSEKSAPRGGWYEMEELPD
jgi:hypothetical protein